MQDSMYHAYSLASMLLVDYNSTYIDTDASFYNEVFEGRDDAYKSALSDYRYSSQEKQEIKDTIRAITRRLIDLCCRIGKKDVQTVEEHFGFASAAKAITNSLDTLSTIEVIEVINRLRNRLAVVADIVDARLTMNPFGAPLPDRPYLDEHMVEKAQQDGKTVISLGDAQTMAESMAIWSSRYLNPMVLVRDYRAMWVRSYSENRLDELDQAINSAISADSRDYFTYERKNVWLEKLVNLIDSNSCFVSVNAMHLSGRNGLIQLLRERGITVEPVIGGSYIDMHITPDNLRTSNDDTRKHEERVQQHLQTAKDELERYVSEQLRKKGERGLLTIMFRFSYRDVGKELRDQQLLIEFIDRQDILSYVTSMISEALHDSDVWKTGQVYEMTLQIEL